MLFKVRGDILNRIRHKRDLCDPRDIEAWRVNVEPRIKRDSTLYRDCLMWIGSHTAKGEPKVDVTDFTKPSGNKRTSILLKRMVALMFIDPRLLPKKANGSEDWEVAHICPNKSCLTPEHLIVCMDHPKQRNEDELRALLEPGTYYEP